MSASDEVDDAAIEALLGEAIAQLSNPRTAHRMHGHSGPIIEV